jgi:geranylgeranyl pyrophosphate synthase
VNNIQQLKNNIDELKLEMTERSISALTNEINELVLAGGKKFRPGLMFLMGEVFKVAPERLRIYARAVELTHLASLIHDDVIDDSDKRRNHPTLNSLRNNTTAILAGDFVLATVMGELASANNNELLKDLTKCIQDLADGEWLQYDLKSKENVKFEDLELVCIKKTGSLIRWCCTTPGKLAGHKDIDSLAQLGEKIGLIFQMADDIVDGLNASGRPPFQDIINGQLNFVTLKLIELYPELAVSVYKFKENPMVGIPWTMEQYHEAIRAVDKAINLENAAVVSQFSRLCEERGKMNLVPIFKATVDKIQSNYAAIFENLSGAR